jgi:hypothetical protein
VAAGEPLAAPQRIELAPGQTRSFTAAWPAGRDALVLTLAPDRFSLDDALPFVKPVPRQVRVANLLSGTVGELVGRMVAVADGVALVDAAAEADLVIAALDTQPATSAVLVAMDPSGAEGAPRGLDPAWVAVEDHPLTRDLGWGGLLSGPAGDIRLTAADTPLVWKGARPLAFLRTTLLDGGARVESLVLNWDLASSTAARTAAVVVMLQRFVERVRGRIPRGWAENVETGQLIPLPDGRQPRAPDAPGFFTIPLLLPTGDARQLMTGAAHFADARECDFREAAPVDTLDTIRLERIRKRAVEDPWAALWVAVVAAALLAAWGWNRTP